MGLQCELNKKQIEDKNGTQIVTYRQTPIVLHPFSREKCFSLNSVLATPHQQACLNLESLSPAYNFNTAWAIKKAFSAGVEVTATLTNLDTQKDLLMNILSFQVCLTSTHFCEMNKTAENHITAFGSTA